MENMQKKILIVDDSPSEVAKFKDILRKSGFDFTAVSNGTAGVNTAAEIQPALILMDVVMDGMNGFQATRKIRQQQSTAHIPIIIVTTKDQKTDQVWAERQGADAFLTKPVDEELLLSTIHRLLEKGTLTSSN